MTAWPARLAVAILAAAPLCLATERAEAVTYTLAVTGTINESSSPLFTIGEAASMTVIYESPSPDSEPANPNAGLYLGATLSGVVEFGAYTFTTGTSGRFEVIDDISIPSPDLFKWTTDFTDSLPAGLTVVQVIMGARGGTSLLSSDALPTSDLAFALLDGNSEFYINGPEIGAVRASLDSLSIGPTAVVPAPLGLPLILSGVAMLAGLRRATRRAAAPG